MAGRDRGRVRPPGKRKWNQRYRLIPPPRAPERRCAPAGVRVSPQYPGSFWTLPARSATRLCRSLAASAVGSVVPGRSPGAIIPCAILEPATVAANNQAVRGVRSPAGRQVLSANVSAGATVIHVGMGVDVGHANLPVIWALCDAVGGRQWFACGSQMSLRQCTAFVLLGAAPAGLPVPLLPEVVRMAGVAPVGAWF